MRRPLPVNPTPSVFVHPTHGEVSILHPVECPTCRGEGPRVSDEGPWGFHGQTPSHEDECPTCGGIGVVGRDGCAADDQLSGAAK